eukprot:sb/3462112/
MRSTSLIRAEKNSEERPGPSKANQIRDDQLQKEQRLKERELLLQKIRDICHRKHLRLNELRKIDSFPVFDYGTATPVSLATPSYTDAESEEDGEDERDDDEIRMEEDGGEGGEVEEETEDVETRPRSKSFREPSRVINLTPLNKDKSYSFLDEFFQSNTAPLYRPPNEEPPTTPKPPQTPQSDEKKVVYKVADNDSLNSIALKFNLSPAVVKQHNGLISEVIFPGQVLTIPIEEAREVQADLLPVLTTSTTTSSTTKSSSKKRFNKYEMRRITRFDGSVGGTTLLTSNAFIFRANVSDKLVIRNGQSSYNVSIPLDSISGVLMFESFDQLLENIQATTKLDGCTMCSDIKQKLVNGNTGSDQEDDDVMKEDEEEVPEITTYPTVKIVAPGMSDFDTAFAGSITPSDGNSVLSEMISARRDSTEVLPLGETPSTYSPQLSTCEHEFQGYNHTAKRRVNPFTVVDESLIIPSFNSAIVDPLGMRRVESDTSLATQEFFKKIDENTSQMQSVLHNDNIDGCNVFVSIHAIICGRTHGKPSYQYETEEGYKLAYFWVCVREKDIVTVMDNFFNHCPHLSPVDDSSNCLLRCAPDYHTRLNDVIHPEKEATFVPREVDTGLVSEPFSGSLVSPPDKVTLLSEAMMGDLQPYLPCHIIGIDIHLVYSLSLHGMSLRSLYTNCGNYPETPCLLVVKDSGGYVFGAYLSQGIVESPKYYGSGETFLFRHSPDLKCFFWQGSNHYFMMGRSDYFTIGAGDGNFALYLDEMLQKGTSNRSLTFYNEVLSSKESFDILGVEVWCFTDDPLVSDSDSLSSEQSRSARIKPSEF